MVARPRLTVSVERMSLDDLPAVQTIERRSFSTPWPPHAYRNELETNRLAHYLVAKAGPEVVGFVGLWLMVDEAHITTFAVHPDWRRQGVGERMLLAALDLGRSRGAREATLEVRQSNGPARRLYEKYGFRVMGVRPRYYTDNNEDALIMTTEALDSRSMQGRLSRLRAELEARAEREPGPSGGSAQRVDPVAAEDAPRGGPASPGTPREGDGSAALPRGRLPRWRR